MDNLTFDSWFT